MLYTNSLISFSVRSSHENWARKPQTVSSVYRFNGVAPTSRVTYYRIRWKVYLESTGRDLLKCILFPSLPRRTDENHEIFVKISAFGRITWGEVVSSRFAVRKYKFKPDQVINYFVRQMSVTTSAFLIPFYSTTCNHS